MTKILRSTLGALKDITVTIQATQEGVVTQTTLPTSEPGTAQVSYTVASGDLPTFTAEPKQKVWIARISVAGKFVTAGTLSWRMKKNGNNVATSSGSVAANTYWTLSSHFSDVAVGDVLTIFLWSNQTDSYWDWKGYQIHPTRFGWKLTKVANQFLYGYCMVTVPTILLQPNWTTGNPKDYGTFGNFLAINNDFNKDYSAAFTTPYMGVAHSTTGMFKLYAGDGNGWNTAWIRTDAGYRPYDDHQSIPGRICFRFLEPGAIA